MRVRSAAHELSFSDESLSGSSLLRLQERRFREKKQFNRQSGKLQGTVMNVQENLGHLEGGQEKCRSRAIEHVSDAVVITDIHGAIEYVNPAFEQLTGYSFEEILGQNPRILNGGNYEEGFFTQLWQDILGGKIWKGRLTNRKKNGELFVEDATISPIRAGDGTISGFIGVKRNISTEITLEKQLIQAQKMAVLGLLSSGIAHDVNNILAVIVGYAELAKEQLPPNNPLLTDINRILDAGERATALVGQILTFGRPSKEGYECVDISAVMKKVISILNDIVPSTIELKHQLNYDCGKILGDENKLYQIIFNLVMNSIQSMQDKRGLICINLSRLHISTDNTSPYSHMDNGNYAVITVEDDGCGIEEKNLRLIFDPFFSTKEKRNGTGLGLSIVEKIVKEHNGTISLKSEVRKGTMFSIFFPIFQESTVPFNQSDQCARPMVFAKTRILLVDDNIDLAQIAKIRLERFGHEVDVFSNSRQALERYRSDIDSYDILITDMNMPEMTGEELSVEVRKLSNKVRIIIISGYIDEETMAKLYAMGIDKVLMKPLKFIELNNSIKEFHAGELIFQNQPGQNRV